MYTFWYTFQGRNTAKLTRDTQQGIRASFMLKESPTFRRSFIPIHCESKTCCTSNIVCYLHVLWQLGICITWPISTCFQKSYPYMNFRVFHAFCRYAIGTREPYSYILQSVTSLGAAPWNIGIFTTCNIKRIQIRFKSTLLRILCLSQLNLACCILSYFLKLLEEDIRCN